MAPKRATPKHAVRETVEPSHSTGPPVALEPTHEVSSNDELANRQQPEPPRTHAPPLEGSEEEETHVQQLLERAQRKARIAAMWESIALQERIALEHEARTRNHQNPVAKRPYADIQTQESTHYRISTPNPTQPVEPMQVDSGKQPMGVLPEYSDDGSSSGDEDSSHSSRKIADLPIQGTRSQTTQSQNSHAETSHTETSQPTPQGRAPPPPPRDFQYQGKNIKEFSIWESRLTTHFQRSPRYFVNDEVKIADGKLWIGDEILYLWDSHVKELNRPPTFRDFLEFCLRRIDNPENLQTEAYQKHMEARQRSWQSVRDFSAYLKQWEDQFAEPYTTGQRMEHIHSRLLPEVRSFTNRYCQKRDHDTYESYISSLQDAENDLPGRKEAISKKNPKSSHVETSQPFSAGRPLGQRVSIQHSQPKRPKPPQTNKGYQRTTGTTQGFDKKPGTCNYCKKPNHWANECRIRMADEEKNKNPQPQRTKI